LYCSAISSFIHGVLLIGSNVNHLPYFNIYNGYLLLPNHI
jgi:hypothetical protein